MENVLLIYSIFTQNIFLHNCFLTSRANSKNCNFKLGDFKYTYMPTCELTQMTQLQRKQVTSYRLTETNLHRNSKTQTITCSLGC